MIALRGPCVKYAHVFILNGLGEEPPKRESRKTFRYCRVDNFSVFIGNWIATRAGFARVFFISGVVKTNRELAGADLTRPALILDS